MSNSARAKLRRSKRSKATKHQRDVMGSQHFGDRVVVRKSEAKATGNTPVGLSLIEQKMAEMKSKLSS